MRNDTERQTYYFSSKLVSESQDDLLHVGEYTAREVVELMSINLRIKSARPVPPFWFRGFDAATGNLLTIYTGTQLLVA